MRARCHRSTLYIDRTEICVKYVWEKQKLWAKSRVSGVGDGGYMPYVVFGDSGEGRGASRENLLIASYSDVVTA